MFSNDWHEPYASIRGDAVRLAEQAAAYAEAADERSTLDPQLHRLLRESGMAAVAVPQAYGGRLPSVDALAFCLVREVLMGTSAHLDAMFAMQGIGSFAISTAGSEEQRRAWLPLVASGEALAALALTEPHAGSDLRAIRTEVQERAGTLVLRGTKSYISNAGEAHFYCVFAREGDSYSLVLVPADAHGLRIEPGPDLYAPAVIGSLAFDEVELPSSARIGRAGDGFDLVLSTLGTFRVSMAGAALGVAQASLEQAARHARTRETFGRPLVRHGPVAALLADSWTELEMARLLTYRAAERAREDPLANVPYSSMAKLAATEMAGRVVDRCVQVMGRFGIERSSPVGRLYRHARPMRIAEGASEILRLGIARQLCEEVP